MLPIYSILEWSEWSMCCILRGYVLVFLARKEEEGPLGKVFSVSLLSPPMHTRGKVKCTIQSSQVTPARCVSPYSCLRRSYTQCLRCGTPCIAAQMPTTFSLRSMCVLAPCVHNATHGFDNGFVHVYNGSSSSKSCGI